MRCRGSRSENPDALKDAEAEAWDQLAGACCYRASASAIRKGVRPGADNCWHLIGCPNGKGYEYTLLEASRLRLPELLRERLQRECAPLTPAGTIAWALGQLAAGHCVRRAGWPAFRYLTLSRRGRMFVHGEHDQVEQPALKDLQATDWEVYEGQMARFNQTLARASHPVR
jgi:hypothetical protein